MRSRLVQLIDSETRIRSPWSDMESRTGIPRQRWQNAYYGRQRIHDNMIEALGAIWPQYICWLVTGKTHAGLVQVVPEVRTVSEARKTNR
jgi:hypothetical protein